MKLQILIPFSRFPSFCIFEIYLPAGLPRHGPTVKAFSLELQ